ncbi:MAG: hypothetical protein H0V12_06160, partial [Chloroflexi bacterium]|nr:hypothetical protein [Chloroflexota bacterium]
HEAFGLTLLESAVGGARVVASDIPAHREVAGYLPDDLVSLVGGDVGGQALARVIERAADAPSAGPPIEWPLPTWEGMADGVLECYRACHA